MSCILILGGGRIGSSIAYLLQQVLAKETGGFSPPITVADQLSSMLKSNPLIECDKRVLDIKTKLPKLLDELRPELVINALPHELNSVVIKHTLKRDISYLDMSEDVPSRKLLEHLAPQCVKATLLPQQGLAPGIVNIMGAWLVNQHERKGSTLTELRLRVGALPQVARGKLGYATTWSVDGLVNEYLNDVEELVDSAVVTKPGLSGFERLMFRGVELEAFRTSGGVADLPRLLIGRVKNVNYKTLRWPGHHEAMQLLLDEFKLDRELLKMLFTAAVPSRVADCVYLLVSLDVQHDGRIDTYDMGRRYVGLNVNGHRFDAIQATTALGVTGVVELLLKGELSKGIVTHDKIDYLKLEQTESGKLLNTATDTYLNGVW